jgi:hypothetical protein
MHTTKLGKTKLGQSAAARAGLCAGAALAGLCLALPTARAQEPQLLFDDFSYAQPAELGSNGWIVRTEVGWPGVQNATWGMERLSFHDDPEQPGNRFVRMSSETDGSGVNTRQSQFCHARKYFEGTYAARVFFRDAPSFGPDGDQVVQTFYTIAPQKAPMDPDYSEQDFEYLPNGGWGQPELTMFGTTWETFQLEPWIQDNVSTRLHGSLQGWHTLVLQIHGGNVKYFVDGRPLGNHAGKVYPEVPMSINFNLWFTREGAIPSSEPRQYQEDIDWVFHQSGSALSHAEVIAKVAALRGEGVKFRDTVPAREPALASPCNF